MLVKSQWGWVIGLACITAVACGDDDDSGGGTGGNGGTSNAGHAGSAVSGGSTKGGSSGHGGGGSSSGGSAGDAGMAALGGDSTQGGAAGAQSPPNEGGMGGEATSSGQGGASMAGASSSEAGQAGIGGAPDANAAGHGVCPALGATFKVGPYACKDCFPDDRVAWAAAFGCDVSGDNTFSVTRFQVDTERVEELFVPHTSIAGAKRFAFAPDCEPDGLEALTYTSYPAIAHQILEPGIYSAVSCTVAAASHTHYAVPPTATNVDCPHATVLDDNGNAPADLVLDGSPRYFAFTIANPYHTIDLYLNTSQSNASGSVTLSGPTSPSLRHDYLLDLPFTFSALPNGDYCAEVSVSPGVSFSVQSDRKN
ncbi:MAG TPA: hypothetical protein VHB79_18335 [Polyangiaceae bacterium]|nr:hypothetical protein [Polyangiaceae bacterium]